MNAKQMLDEMVRDFCAVGPKPKSEVRRQIKEFAAETAAKEAAEERADRAERALRIGLDLFMSLAENFTPTEMKAYQIMREALSPIPEKPKKN